jgi:hypothetical protein
MTLQPTPELTGLDVVTLCMDALAGQRTANEALEICFDFSSDRCRAVVGGTLEAFVQYADNPVFGTLVHCDAYDIVSLGPIIPASSHGGLGSRRGEMQTVLVEIHEGISLKSVRKGVVQQDMTRRRRPTIQERLRKRQMEAKEMESGYPLVVQEDDGGGGGGQGKRRFLWTLQKEIRPPRQDCWLVHEVLFTQNAMHQTY